MEQSNEMSSANNINTPDDTEITVIDASAGVTSLAPSIFAARGGETIIRELFPKDVELGGVILSQAFEDDPWFACKLVDHSSLGWSIVCQEKKEEFHIW